MNIEKESQAIQDLLAVLLKDLALKSLMERDDEIDRNVVIKFEMKMWMDICPCQGGDIDVAVYGIQEKLKRIITQCNHLH